MPNITLPTGQFFINVALDDVTNVSQIYNCDSGSTIYIDYCVLAWTSGVAAQGINILSPDGLDVYISMVGGLGDYTSGVPATVPLLGTITGLTGLGTGTLTDCTIGTPGDTVVLPLNHTAIAHDGFKLVAGQANIASLFISLAGVVGTATPAQAIPGIAAAGPTVSGTVLVNSTTPIQVQGKVGGVPLDVNVSDITIDHVTVNDPMPIKTTGTDSVRVIPG